MKNENALNYLMLSFYASRYCNSIAKEFLEENKINKAKQAFKQASFWFDNIFYTSQLIQMNLILKNA